MSPLEGKVALVTGGSRGIGAAIARRLARDGAAVAFTYATAAGKAQAVAKQIDADGSRVLVIQADSADPDAITAAVEPRVLWWVSVNMNSKTSASARTSVARFSMMNNPCLTLRV